MPKSLVLYTSNEVLARLRERLTQGYGHEPMKPYTLSVAHKSEGDSRRVRITELLPYSLSPIIDDLIGSGQALPVSTADKDVRGASYEELFGSADRFQRTAVLQLSSPTIITLGGYHVSFPVLPLMLSQYVHVWNTAARRERISRETIEYVQEFAKVLCYSLVTNGYFKMENSTARKYEAPIIDMSASGLLFAHTSTDLVRDLLVHTDLELTVKLEKHTTLIGARIMR